MPHSKCALSGCASYAEKLGQTERSKLIHSAARCTQCRLAALAPVRPVRIGCMSASFASSEDCRSEHAQPGHVASAFLRPRLSLSRPATPSSRRGAACCTAAVPRVAQSVAAHSLARDSSLTLLSLLFGLFLVKVFDFLQYSGALDQKVSRKLVHITAGPGLLLLWPLFRLVLIGTGTVKDEGTVNAVSREGDRRELLRGPLYYVLVLIAATMIYWRESPIGITAVAVMSGGDGFADLVGRRFGSAKLPHNSRKSWAGTLAMFLGGWGLAVAFIAYFQHLELFECALWAIAGSVGVIAAAAAIFESLPVDHWLDDNLSVPLVAALLGQCLFARGVLLVA